MKRDLVFVGALFLHLVFSNAHAQERPNVARAGTGPLDVSWPGNTPELFAPGVVNTDGVEINLVFDREYTELFFARTVDKVFFIYTSRLVNGTWTAPERLELYPEGVRGEAVDMALSPDGGRRRCGRRMVPPSTTASPSTVRITCGVTPSAPGTIPAAM